MATIEVSDEIILERLRFLYGEGEAPGVFRAVEKLLEKYEGRIPLRESGWSERDAFLITYGDSLVGEGPPLQALLDFLNGRVGDLISFVHLLPFYPYTSDDGFAVTDFREVRKDLGGWNEVDQLAQKYRLVFDGVINHVSSLSGYMKKYSAGDPEFAEFFIALDPATGTSSVLRTRDLPLLHEYSTSAGAKWLWTTFSQDQIDLNFRNPRVLLEILDVLLFYAEKGASMIRLDAIPYLWKELGTSCAHLPQTHELIKLIRDVYDHAAPHVLLLTETNVPHLENLSYFGHKGDEAQIIYNFSLPPLIVWSLFKGNAGVLSRWADGLEFVGDRATYLNITATHDGIGMRPTEGILSKAERAEMVQLAYDRGGDMTGKRNGNGTVSPYELNISYFDAINDPRAEESIEIRVGRFLVSQAIPMALMGMPGVYIHSLLGSGNDHEGVRRSGRARSINRQQLFLEDLKVELADPLSQRSRVLSEYSRLLWLRRQQSAFHPDARQKILDLGPELFVVRRSNIFTDETITALHNVSGGEVRARLEAGGWDVINGEMAEAGEIRMAPYQVRWIREQ